MKLRKFLLALAALFAAAGSALAFDAWEQRIDKPDHDIVIVYANDVHCAVDDNIGYAGLASFRDEMRKQTPYVALVDCGDIIQGGVIGAVTRGEAPIEIMNAIGFDAAVLGNHEFDYGLPRLADLMSKSNVAWVGANVRYTGSGKSPLPKLARYKIMNFGPTKVAFIGVSTPESITTSTPRYFMDGDEFVWSFGESAKKMYEDVQLAVDECRISGADYVIAITHLGDDKGHGEFSSPALVRSTRGIDAVIDGHDHHVLPSIYERSRTGKLVPISSTGTQLANIGRVVITRDGNIINGIVSGWSERDPKVGKVVADVKARADKVLGQVIAKSNVAIADNAGGVREVRARENQVASLAADAVRAAVGSEIAFFNGGAVRNSIPAGDITLGDVMAVCPFGMNVCSIRAKGQQILDALEWGACMTQKEFARDGKALGEFGGFLHPSNLRYTIETSIESTTVEDAYGAMAGIKGARRVSNVEIFKANGWEPIDPNADYTVGGTAYLILLNGDGNTAFDGCEVVTSTDTLDYMALVEYIRDVLRGDLSAYTKKEGRITVK